MIELAALGSVAMVTSVFIFCIGALALLSHWSFKNDSYDQMMKSQKVAVSQSKKSKAKKKNKKGIDVVCMYLNFFTDNSVTVLFSYNI